MAQLFGIFGNVVAAVLVGWIVSSALVSLISVTRIALHNGRWWRMGLASFSTFIVPFVLSALYTLLPPALLGGGVWLGAWLSPAFAAWLPSAWGGWAGAAFGLARGIYLAAKAMRLPEVERVFMSTSYDSLHEGLPERLSIQQQTFVKAYRAAHQEQQRQEAEEAEAAVAEASPLDDWARLRFRVDEVWTSQQATEAAPYFASGGDWTVLRCTLAQHERGSFFLAERSGAPPEDSPMAWGEGRIWVTDIADAESILAAWRVAFPPEEVEDLGDEDDEDEEDAAPVFGPARDPGPAIALEPPLQPDTAVLGRSVARTENGFSGRGTWSAAKWFFAEGSCEIFVNYSVAEREGEFAEKDECYRAGMLAAIAGLARREPGSTLRP